MAAQCDTLSGYLQQQQSDQGSNSERSTDSPLPGSEEDLSGPHPLPDPEWTEERFRVDRKKLEIMLLGLAQLKNVLVAASLLRTFLKAPCHLELFQENNLSRGRPRVGVLRTYHAPRHASLPKHFCLCSSASVYVT
uniref:Uncharacterized protein n=1 Tax=Xiphophorus couchianus TaxID=32473 RepID=A0A3B5LRQ4_9TELE